MIIQLIYQMEKNIKTKNKQTNKHLITFEKKTSKFWQTKKILIDIRK